MTRTVKVFIETSGQVGRMKYGICAYLLEYIKPNGEPVTSLKDFSMLDATKDRLTLRAMIDALERITDKEAEVVFVPADKGIYYIIQNGWHLRWKENGWKGTKGTVKNADLWEEYVKAAAGRTISMSDEHNSYGTVMRNHIKKSRKEE